ASAPLPFFRSLERNFRHYLENERERGEIDNLVSRAGALLRDDDRFHDWIPQAQASDSWWGLAEWDDPAPYQRSEDDLVSSAWAVGEVVIFRYSHTVGRASPILATDELGRFLVELFGRVGALLTLRLLAVVFRRRFDLAEPRTVEGAEAVEAVARPEEPDEHVTLDAALGVVAELTPRQAEVLLRKQAGDSLDAIAEVLGIARGTVDNELVRAGTIIDRHAADVTTREAILENVLDA